MKICIIVFSPSGHTLGTAERMIEIMLERGIEAQLLNITGKEKIFREDHLSEYLDREVKEHDIICIGGPVYAGHMEFNVKKIIEALPGVDSKWGKLAVPFVTYGGVHSSIALKEAGNLLFKKGRINVLGLKVAAFHTLTRTLDKQINCGKPDEKDDDILIQIINRLENIFHSRNAAKDVRKSFNYAHPLERMLFTLLSQDFFHKKYRPVAIDKNKCIGCGRCINKCPVNMLGIADGKAFVANRNRQCIICAECYFNCPQKAIEYPYLNIAGKRLKMVNKLETPQSAVYPLE